VGRRRRASFTGGILIPATAQVSRRLAWAETVAVGPTSDRSRRGQRPVQPEDQFEVEVQGDEYIILRERDIHAVAATASTADRSLSLNMTPEAGHRTRRIERYPPAAALLRSDDPPCPTTQMTTARRPGRRSRRQQRHAPGSTSREHRHERHHRLHGHPDRLYRCRVRSDHFNGTVCRGHRPDASDSAVLMFAWMNSESSTARSTPEGPGSGAVADRSTGARARPRRPPVRAQRPLRLRR